MPSVLTNVEQGLDPSRFTEGKSVNKIQLIDALSKHYEGNRKAARHALESVLDTITREVAKGEKVAITGFGAFEKAVRPARMVRNPRTGERKRAGRTAVPKFRAGAELKAVVAGTKKLPALAVAAMSRPARRPTAAASVTSKRAGAKKGTAKKSTAKKTTAKKTAPAKKSAAKKTTAKRTAPARKSTAKKTTAKKTAPAKKSAAKKTTAKKTAPAKKSTAKKSTAKKTTAKKTTAKKTARKR
ncbi:MAG TPA: HU family DNA-binding protein [Nocardioidaceae bacterium]|nr:HU family DNA-binding protein [Nocardioidaceae bacterium]